MITGISTFETEKYISIRDPLKTEEEGATVFELGSLDAEVKAKIMDSSVVMIQTQEGMKVNPNKNGSALEAVKFGLVGWKNFKDAQGNDIPFERENTAFLMGKQYPVCTQKTLRAIPSDIMRELADRILAVNSITEATAKKS